jgi:AraC family transcriptional activator of pobA
MNREAIPAVGMSIYGQGNLLRGGFVVEPFEESRAWNPTLLHPHYHDFFQISLIRGEARLMHDFREADVSGDTLLFLSPGEIHAVTTTTRIAGTVISFTREFFESGPEGGSELLLELPFFYATDTTPWIGLPEDAGEIAAALCQELQQEFDHARPGAPEIIRALLTILLVKARRWHSPESAPLAGNRATTLVRHFHLAIERHFREWQALAPYAKELGITVNHLNDVIRETTGQAAGEHIRQRRLLDAKRFLLHSELSVSEIGYRLGFKDPSYFARFFRRYQDQTPAEFRDEIREKYQKEAG